MCLNSCTNPLGLLLKVEKTVKAMHIPVPVCWDATGVMYLLGSRDVLSDNGCEVPILLLLGDNLNISHLRSCLCNFRDVYKIHPLFALIQ